MKLKVTIDAENPPTPVHRFWDTFHCFQRFREDILEETKELGLKVKSDREEELESYTYTLCRTERQLRVADRRKLRQWFFKSFFEPQGPEND